MPWSSCPARHASHSSPCGSRPSSSTTLIRATSSISPLSSTSYSMHSMAQEHFPVLTSRPAGAPAPVAAPRSVGRARDQGHRCLVLGTRGVHPADRDAVARLVADRRVGSGSRPRTPSVRSTDTMVSPRAIPAACAGLPGSTSCTDAPAGDEPSLDLDAEQGVVTRSAAEALACPALIWSAMLEGVVDPDGIALSGAARRRPPKPLPFTAAAVSMPMTCPFLSTSGPPESPGSMLASIWTRPWSVSGSRPSPLAVMVWPRAVISRRPYSASHPRRRRCRCRSRWRRRRGRTSCRW